MSRPHPAISWPAGLHYSCSRRQTPPPSASWSNLSSSSSSSSVINHVPTQLPYHSPKLAPHPGPCKLNNKSGHIHLNLHFLIQTLDLIRSIRLHYYSVSFSGTSHTNILVKKKKKVLCKDLRSLNKNASPYRLKSFSTANSRVVLHLFLKEQSVNIFLPNSLICCGRRHVDEPNLVACNHKNQKVKRKILLQM